MARNYVGDGLDLAGSIDPVPGLYDGAEFMYRPATGLASDLINLARTPEERFNARAKVVSDSLIPGAFVFVNADGTKTPGLTPSEGAKPEQTAELVKRLHRGQFDTLFNHVMGYVGPNLVTEGNGSGAASG